MASESWICCEENFPSFLKNSFMQKKAIPIAIINALMSRVSIIFCNFALQSYE